MIKQKRKINYLSILFIVLTFLLLFSFYFFHENLPLLVNRLIMMLFVMTTFFTRYFQTEKIKIGEVFGTFCALIVAALLF